MKHDELSERLKQASEDVRENVYLSALLLEAAWKIEEFLKKDRSLGHVQMVEYIKSGIVGHDERRVALFDDRMIDSEDVRDLIYSGEEYDSRVLYMNRSQFWDVLKRWEA